MILPIVKIPDPVLRQKARPVKKITPELVQLAKNMLETMDHAHGIGLAAPQIGQSIQLFVARHLVQESERSEDDYIPETILFNPVITKRSSETDLATEGCLSIPGQTGVVERALKITVTGLNEKGRKVTIEAEHLYARAMQHEIDHLNGVLFTDHLTEHSVVFYGTSDFAVPALQALVEHPQFRIDAVVTETDKPAGRGHKMTPSPVKLAALAHNIPVLQPESLNSQSKDETKRNSAITAIKQLKAINPQFQIVASYGKILPQEVLDIPSVTNLNIHPSLLPKYRGATPIQAALLNGDTKTGICIMVMSAEMDAGPIVSAYSYPISSSDTAGTLSTRLAQAAGDQLILALEEILSDKAEVFEQDATKATYCDKIGSGDATIDWSKEPKTIVNHIRAMSPKPGAYTLIDGQMIKIFKAKVVDGQIELDQIVIPGKKPMTMRDLKNGYSELYNNLISLSQK